MYHRYRQFAVTATLLIMATSGGVAAAETCPELEEAHGQLQWEYKELAAKHRANTGAYIPAPVAVWLTEPDCEERLKQYESLRKSYEDLTVKVTGYQEREEKRLKNERKRELERDARVRQEAKELRAEARAVENERAKQIEALRKQAQETMKEIESFLGEDIDQDPLARLNSAITHLGKLQEFLDKLSTGIPPKFEAPTTTLKIEVSCLRAYQEKLENAHVQVDRAPDATKGNGEHSKRNGGRNRLDGWYGLGRDRKPNARANARRTRARNRMVVLRA